MILRVKPVCYQNKTFGDTNGKSWHPSSTDIHYGQCRNGHFFSVNHTGNIKAHYAILLAVSTLFLLKQQNFKAKFYLALSAIICGLIKVTDSHKSVIK